MNNIFEDPIKVNSQFLDLSGLSERHCFKCGRLAMAAGGTIDGKTQHYKCRPCNYEWTNIDITPKQSIT